MGSSLCSEKRSESLKCVVDLPSNYHQSESNSSIYIHQTQDPLREYVVLLNETDLDKYNESLVFREKSEEMVQVRFGKNYGKGQGYWKIKVYLQLVAINMSQIVHLHYADAMAILYWSLISFYKFYRYFGNFIPHAKMIGFLQNGLIKIWANACYQKSAPQICYKLFDEQKMVDAIIGIFDDRIDSSTFPINLQGKIQRFKTFEQTIKQIENQVENVGLIPKRILAINLLVNSGREISANETVSMTDHYNKPLDKVIKFNYSKSTEQNKHNLVHFSYGNNSFVLAQPLIVIKPSQYKNLHFQPQIWNKVKFNANYSPQKINLKIPNKQNANFNHSFLIHQSHLPKQMRSSLGSLSKSAFSAPSFRYMGNQSIGNQQKIINAPVYQRTISTKVYNHIKDQYSGAKGNLSQIEERSNSQVSCTDIKKQRFVKDFNS